MQFQDMVLLSFIVKTNLNLHQIKKTLQKNFLKTESDMCP